MIIQLTGFIIIVICWPTGAVTVNYQPSSGHQEPVAVLLFRASVQEPAENPPISLDAMRAKRSLSRSNNRSFDWVRAGTTLAGICIGALAGFAIAGPVGAAGAVGKQVLIAAGATAGYQTVNAGWEGRRKRELCNVTGLCDVLSASFIASDANLDGVIEFDEVKIDDGINSTEARDIFNAQDKNKDGVWQPDEVHPCLGLGMIQTMRRRVRPCANEQVQMYTAYTRWCDALDGQHRTYYQC